MNCIVDILFLAEIEVLIYLKRQLSYVLYHCYSYYIIAPETVSDLVYMHWQKCDFYSIQIKISNNCHP